MFDQLHQITRDCLKLDFQEKTLKKYPHLKEDFQAFYLKPTEIRLEMKRDVNFGYIVNAKVLIDNTSVFVIP